MNLIKPAIEYTSKERAALYNSLVTENKKRYAVNGRLTGQQIAAAKAQASRRFKAAGF